MSSRPIPFSPPLENEIRVTPEKIAAAAKAAEDQDDIALSRHDRKAATRLRMHLDLSPADADHERELRRRFQERELDVERRLDGLDCRLEGDGEDAQGDLPHITVPGL